MPQFNEQEVQEWKQKQIAQGFDENVLDGVISSKKAGTPPPVMPSPPPVQQQSNATLGDISLPGNITGRDNIDLGSRIPSPKGSSGFKINTPFGASSSADVFSGGINNGVDIGTPLNTPVSVPEGDWVVQESFSGANPTGGFIGNPVNDGYGNSVLIKNTKTGETLRFSHLGKVGVRPNEKVSAGKILGLSASSGNSSGAHLDVEYRNTKGQLSDVMSSQFSDTFLSSSQ